MRRVAPVVLLAAGALAGAALASEQTIRPGVGIGKVRLGMTLAQVKAKLGPPMLVNARGRVPGGKRYVEYLWNYSEYRIGFVGGASPRVALIATSLRTQRTPGGAGVGLDVMTLRRRAPVSACRAARALPGGGGRWVAIRPGRYRDAYCMLDARTGRSTVFALRGEDCGIAQAGQPPPCTRFFVSEVIVTQPY